MGRALVSYGMCGFTRWALPPLSVEPDQQNCGGFFSAGVAQSMWGWMHVEGGGR